jgi:hypothetical protein
MAPAWTAPALNQLEDFRSDLGPVLNLQRSRDSHSSTD